MTRASLTLAFITPLLFIADSWAIVAAPPPPSQQKDSVTTAAPAPAKHKVLMFAPAQYDSVLSMVPRNDSLHFGSDVIGIGLDTVTSDIVVIAFDQTGNPVKFVFPDSTLKKKYGAGAVPQRAGRPAAKQKLDQRGRTWFIIESAMKSAVVYPMAYSALITDSRTVTGLSFLTVGGAIYGAYAFTKGMELGYGKAGLMNYGSTLFGTFYPNLAASLLHRATSIDNGYKTIDPYSNDTTYRPHTTSEKIRAGMSSVGFPLGIYLGSRLPLVDKDDYGRLAMMEYMSQTMGFLLGYTLPLYLFDPDKDADNYFSTSAALAMALLPGGFYAGYKIVGKREISAGRGVLPWVTGTMGGVTGLLLPTMFKIKTNRLSSMRTMAATSIIGYSVGTWLGLDYHRSLDYTYWQTVFIGVSSGGGALTGLAFPFIFRVNFKHDHPAYSAAGIIGAWTGFFLGERLSLSLFEKSDRDRNASGLRLSLPGLAALPTILTRDRHPASGNPYHDLTPALPVANVEWKF